MSSTEIFLDYGGDFFQQSNGDLVLATNSLGDPIATIQRIYRLLFTNPRAFLDGAPTSMPDDVFNPDWGAGLPSVVGSMVTTQLLAAIQTRILQALSTDPTIAQTPAPTVAISQVSTTEIEVGPIVCYGISGNVVTVPSRRLSVTTGLLPPGS